MNSVDYYLINLICDFLLLLIINDIYEKLLIPNDRRKWLRWVAALAWYVGTILANELFHIAIVNLVTNLLLMFTITLAFGGKLWKKIVITAIIGVMSASCDLLAYAIVAPLLGTDRYYYSFAFTVILMYIVDRIIGIIFAKRIIYDIERKELAILGIIPLLSIIILYCITACCSEYEYLTISSIAVVGICIISFAIFNYMNRSFELKWKQKLLENQIDAYKNELSIMQESNRKIQNIRHDLKNHLIEIECLAQEERTSEIINYICEMRDDMNIGKRTVHTGKYEIDSLLNYLIEDAKNKGINIITDITLPEDIEISNYKLNIILGNLIENAIEASQNSQIKEIQLVIKFINGTLYIKVINSWNQKPIREDNLFKSSKEDNCRHGIGLRSVKDIVKMQQGIVNITVDEDKRLFIVEVIIYIMS